jgi:hypothetical protein
MNTAWLLKLVVATEVGFSNKGNMRVKYTRSGFPCFSPAENSWRSAAFATTSYLTLTEAAQSRDRFSLNNDF